MSFTFRTNDQFFKKVIDLLIVKYLGIGMVVAPICSVAKKEELVKLCGIEQEQTSEIFFRELVNSLTSTAILCVLL